MCNFRTVTVFIVCKTCCWNFYIDFLNKTFFINLCSLVISGPAIYQHNHLKLIVSHFRIIMYIMQYDVVLANLFLCFCLRISKNRIYFLAPPKKKTYQIMCICIDNVCAKLQYIWPSHYPDI